MNRNQRRLGRMHQKKINDHGNKNERHKKHERTELDEETESELLVRNKDMAWRAKSKLQGYEIRQERAENKHYKRIENRRDKSTYWSDGRETGHGKMEKQDIIETQEKSVTEVDVVMTPKFKLSPAVDRFTMNKCCYVTPNKHSFGQITDIKMEPGERTDKYQAILKEQYGFDPLLPETIKHLKQLSKQLNIPKVENSSQYTSDKKVSVQEILGTLERMDGCQRQYLEDVNEIDKYNNQGNFDSYPTYAPENIRISEVPQIKIIAKKYSRFKKNNVELRKLDEKVVCVEYDVFLHEAEKPSEKLRAFFSIRPISGQNVQIDEIPSKVKNTFNISDEDLRKLSEKEIEILDGKITENKTYLEDLKRILRRKQAIHAKKNKETLDLMSLYDMARRECPPLEEEFSNGNFLSKAELQEIKQLILRKCGSSLQGISRRTISKDPALAVDISVISQSIMTELLRESGSIRQ